MKKLFYILFLVLLVVGCRKEIFRNEICGVIGEPLPLEADSISHHQYDSVLMHTKALPIDTLSQTFFAEWEEQSAAYAALSASPVVDSICQRVWEYYRHDSLPYIVLPARVAVMQLDSEVVFVRNMKNHDYDQYHFLDWGTEEEWESKITACRNYIPHIRVDRTVLYNIETKYHQVAAYLGGVVFRDDVDLSDEESKALYQSIRKDRVNDAHRYIYAEQACAGNYWYLQTPPFIWDIIFYRNGTVACVGLSFCHGEWLFFPNGSDDTIVIGDWIE